MTMVRYRLLALTAAAAVWLGYILAGLGALAVLGIFTHGGH
jgi:hypothetical protein